MNDDHLDCRFAYGAQAMVHLPQDMSQTSRWVYMAWHGMAPHFCTLCRPPLGRQQKASAMVSHPDLVHKDLAARDACKTLAYLRTSRSQTCAIACDVEGFFRRHQSLHPSWAMGRIAAPQDRPNKVVCHNVSNAMHSTPHGTSTLTWRIQ